MLRYSVVESTVKLSDAILYLPPIHLSKFQAMSAYQPFMMPSSLTKTPIEVFTMDFSSRRMRSVIMVVCKPQPSDEDR